MQGVLADLSALEKAAAAADLPPSATSWADWEESLRVLAEAQSGGQKAIAAGLRKALQARLQVSQRGLLLRWYHFQRRIMATPHVHQPKHSR